MKSLLLASALGLAVLGAAPVAAQHAGHMPEPAAPPAAPAPSSPAAPPREVIPAADQPAPDSAGMDHDMRGTDPNMPGMSQDMPGMDHEAAPAMAHEMTGALGAYPMEREASGTSWQPDSSLHPGIHVVKGDWMLMGHLLLNTVYDWQEGPRGGERFFVSGMVMAMAKRGFADGNALQLRAMISPDPLMGKRGYPLHLASGETANGITPLIDRQHPHDLFMELSASYSLRLTDKASVFVYGGLPGEPAFGPPAFMHRMSIMDSPEAPISHHWLDSTHISFGVVTAGLVAGAVKVEASRFNGREPDQNRYDIETGPLDSTAVRLSWNPTRTLSLQASWGRFISPEQLEPGENQNRWSASAIYTRPVGRRGWWSTSAAWGRRSSDGRDLDAFVLESAVGKGGWTLFGRAERTENDELLPAAGHHGPVFTVAKASLGAVRDFRVADHVKLGIGGLFAFNFVPPQLEALYRGDPKGAMGFVRLKID